MPDLDTFYAEAGDTAQLQLGFEDKHGKLILRTPWLEESQGGRVREHSLAAIVLDAEEVEIKMGAHQVGGPGKLGKINLQSIVIDGNGPEIWAGGRRRGEGRLKLNNERGEPAIDADASTGTFTVGAEGSDGRLFVKDKQNRSVFQVSASTGDVQLGTRGADGDLSLRAENGQVVMRLDAGSATLTAGGRTRNGRITLANGPGLDTIDLVARTGSIRLGSGPPAGGDRGVNGDITLIAATGEESVRLSGSRGRIIAGGVGVNGELFVRNDADVDTIRITGSDGDIRFLNADVAEEFTVEPASVSLAVPGTLMSLNDGGDLVPADRPYDQRVVGVIAGAGSYRPAMVLDGTGGDDRAAVAMVGKAFCRATCESGPIAVGDLLTTSSLPGHAQRVDDRSRAMGAVIGKALGPLDVDCGLIPVLVNLQ